MGGQRHPWIRRINQLRPRFQVARLTRPAIYCPLPRVLRRCPPPRADIDIVEKREKEEEETPRPNVRRNTHGAATVGSLLT